MITTLAGERDLDWTGGLVVVGCLLALSVAAYLHDRWARWQARPRRDLPIIVRGRVSDLVVHEDCSHESCTRVLCFCIRIDGPCPDTVSGCWHDGPRYCLEHAFTDCLPCEVEARSEWGHIG